MDTVGRILVPEDSDTSSSADHDTLNSSNSCSVSNFSIESADDHRTDENINSDNGDDADASSFDPTTDSQSDAADHKSSPLQEKISDQHHRTVPPNNPPSPASPTRKSTTDTIAASTSSGAAEDAPNPLGVIDSDTTSRYNRSGTSPAAVDDNPSIQDLAFLPKAPGTTVDHNMPVLDNVQNSSRIHEKFPHSTSVLDNVQNSSKIHENFSTSGPSSGESAERRELHPAQRKIAIEDLDDIQRSGPQKEIKVETLYAEKDFQTSYAKQNLKYDPNSHRFLSTSRVANGTFAGQEPLLSRTEVEIMIRSIRRQHKDSAKRALDLEQRCLGLQEKQRHQELCLNKATSQEQELKMALSTMREQHQMSMSKCVELERTCALLEREHQEQRKQLAKAESQERRLSQLLHAKELALIEQGRETDAMLKVMEAQVKSLTHQLKATKLRAKSDIDKATRLLKEQSEFHAAQVDFEHARLASARANVGEELIRLRSFSTK